MFGRVTVDPAFDNKIKLVPHTKLPAFVYTKTEL